MDYACSWPKLWYQILTMPQKSVQGRLNVIKAGTVCRTVIWPCLVPLALYNYIRQKDQDMYALELLSYRSKTKHPKEFYDKDMGRVHGHWRIRRDMEIIRKFVREQGSL